MTEEKKSMVPKLRFPEFTATWEQRELKDVAEIVGGGTPSTSVPAYWNGSIDWYSPTEIGQENFAKGSKRKISNEGLNNSSAKLLPAHKTILFTSRATIGEAAILEREGATNQGFQSIVTKEGVDVYFLYSYKHHLKKQALIKASGSTFLEISKNEVEGLHVPVPSGEEQAKIGSFFKLVDKAITLHQRKLEGLSKLKKSLLQKMFPKNGSLGPELRFPGFTGDWEQRKLNEIASIYDGTHQTPRYTSNGIPFLSVENITTLQSSKFISEKDFLRDFPVYPKKGDVLLTRIGDVGTANVYERNQKAAFYVSLALLKLRETDPYFVNASFRSNSTRKEVWKRTLHIAFPKKINKNEIGKVNIQIPSLAEQRKIGIFFYSLDRLITLHQRKLESLKKLKKSLLQQMFV